METHASIGKAVQAIRVSAPANMNVPEGALYLGVSERAMRERIARKVIKHARFGKRIILRKVDLDSYLESLVRG